MFLWMSQFHTWLIMSLDFSQEILAAVWEEKKFLPTISISTSHEASFDASHLCEGGKKEIQSRWAPACQVCCWTNALFMCLCQRVVSLMCRNEPGELWGYQILCLAVQWFVLVAAAVPKLLCKMQSYHVKTVGPSCLHCFFGLQILPSIHVSGIYQLLLENFNELKKYCPVSLQIPLGKQI